MTSRRRCVTLGEMSYAVWLWQALSPTRWHIAVPLIKERPWRSAISKWCGVTPTPTSTIPRSNNWAVVPPGLGTNAIVPNATLHRIRRFPTSYSKTAPRGKPSAPTRRMDPSRSIPQTCSLVRTAGTFRVSVRARCNEGCTSGANLPD